MKIEYILNEMLAKIEYASVCISAEELDNKGKNRL
jgi:hypothetical protein